MADLSVTSVLFLRPPRHLATHSTDLKGELCAPKISLLLLPEIVRLDDERHADLSWEKLLQRLEQRLDQLPLRAAHVDDDGEAAFAHVLAAGGGLNTVKMEHVNACNIVITHSFSVSLSFTHAHPHISIFVGTHNSQTTFLSSLP